MGERYVVEMGVGSLRETGGSVMPHELIPEGITVRCETTGTHVLHMAVAGTLVDRVWRAATERGRAVHGALVRVEGAVEQDDDNVGVEYSVAVDSALLPEEVDAIVEAIDPVADLPPALLAGVEVRRVGHA